MIDPLRMNSDVFGQTHAQDGFKQDTRCEFYVGLKTSTWCPMEQARMRPHGTHGYVRKLPCLCIPHRYSQIKNVVPEGRHIVS